jgi:UDP-3-O-[3-hydroxymyristoyl] glucosamine N-acyltransferase
MKPLLVLGPDSTANSAYALAKQAFPQRRVEKLLIPVVDYYGFDWAGLQNFPAGEWQACIAVNEFYINDVRRAFSEAVESRGYEITGLVSPLAQVDEGVALGKGTIVFPGCAVGAGSSVGKYGVLRPNVVLTEDVTVGDYVTLEANVSIREKCVVGSFTTICANSSLARQTEVGEHCYLNLPRQYTGKIAYATFYSPMFENPVRVLMG